MYPDVKVVKSKYNYYAIETERPLYKSGFVPGRSTKWKKAIVKLREGDSIDFFSEI